jgi:hypothetical protein
MLTLSSLCILYTVIYWAYLIKRDETNIFDYPATFWKILLLFTSIISVGIIVFLCVIYLPIV